MQTINILMLGAAKRVSVAKKFEAAGRKVKRQVRLFSYELTSDVPIACVARVVKGLRWSDPGIIADLERVCRELHIDMMLPFVDGAVEIAARFAAENPGVYVPVSSVELCHKMFDKLEADRLFRSLGIPVPEMIPSESITEWLSEAHQLAENQPPTGHRPRLPLIAKPRTGSASKGIVVIETVEDLAKLPLPADEYIFQEYIAEREEYTVDCFVDIEGVARVVSPRRRIEVLGGEVVRTATVDYPELYEAAHLTLARTGLRGAVTIQYLRDMAHGGRLLLMEVNPRLGGGVVCTIQAGANIPWLMIREMLGMEPIDVKWLAGVEIARYWSETVVKKGDKWLP